jgi:hypothetical protein
VEARLNANGISNSGVLPLQRNVQTPNGEETLRVKRLRFAEAQTEEGYIQVAETLTPEYLFLPHFVKHTNGVLRLGRVSLLAHDWKSKAELYKGFVGIGYEPSEHGAIFQINPTVQLEIVGAAFAPKVLARSLIPPIPAIAAITYVVSDLGLPVKALDDAGIPYTLLEKRVVVPAEEAGGVAVIFELA